MPDLVSLALAMFTFGQIGLCISLLVTRSATKNHRLPLSVFLIACAVVIADPVIFNFLPSMRFQAVALTLPAYLIMAPALWLYVEALTSETAWEPERKHIRHGIFFGLGLIVAGLVIALPQSTLEIVFLEGDLGGIPYLGALFLAAFVLIIGLPIQSAFYLVRIYRHLIRYRLRIKESFANIENRELLWINAVLILFAFIWILVAVALISENFFDHTLFGRRVGGIVGIVLVWTISLWGLRQAPGFENHYQDKSTTTLPAVSKYKRSALGDDQAQRIAKKIAFVMKNENLYRDANLSLSKLATKIGASSNHVSQTLNETLGMSFFDYVNQWRIEEAKLEIVRAEDSVLNIALAVGFNTSSSFYKAFKKETGETPRGFRSSSGESNFGRA